MQSIYAISEAPLLAPTVPPHSIHPSIHTLQLAHRMCEQLNHSLIVQTTALKWYKLNQAQGALTKLTKEKGEWSKKGTAGDPSLCLKN